MKNLFINECYKLKDSKTVRVVAMINLIFAVMQQLVPVGSGNPFYKYGFGAPFIWVVTNGSVCFFLYAAIAAELVANEFETGVLRNALSAGVSRKSYFLAKIAGVLGISTLLYLGGVGFFCILRSLINGFNPTGTILYGYGLKLPVYLIATLISVLSYAALFLFLACLIRRTVLTMITAFAITIMESLFKIHGPIMISYDALECASNDYFHPWTESSILSWEFARMFAPCLVMTAVFLTGAYLLFRVRDVR